MPVKKILELPAAQFGPIEDDIPTEVPDVNPRIGPKLMREWYEKRVHDDNLPTAIPAAGPFRASWAGNCSRQIAYILTGATETEPKSVADYWRLDLGTAIHERVQASIPVAYPTAEIERKVDLNTIGIRGSAHLDMLLPYKDNSGKAAVEIKSINGYGFKMSATSFRGQPEGPRTSAKIQGSLAAAALLAGGEPVTDLIVMYLSLESVGADLAQAIGRGDELARFSAEWSYKPDEFVPLAEEEAKRFAEIDDAIFSQGDEPDPTVVGRHIPYVGEIVNPATGTYRLNGKAGKTWQCAYCAYRSRCETDQ